MLTCILSWILFAIEISVGRLPFATELRAGG
jgi:hypothetical protein